MVLGMLVLAAVAIPAPVAAQDDFLITVNGPATLIPGEKAKYTVDVRGGPGGEYRYNATASYGGKVSPITGRTTADNFTLDITAPSVTGQFVVTITVSTLNGSVSNTARHTITVVPPVVISADVTNSGNVAASGVPVRYYADGQLLNATTVDIPANTTKKLMYNWSTGSLAPGQHTVRIEIDPNGQFLHFAGNSTVFEATFYVGDAGWGLANILLAVVFGLLLLVVFFTYMNRGKKKRRPKA